MVLAALAFATLHPPDPPQINVVVRVANSAAMDEVARRLAARTHMRFLMSGEGILRPPGAHGIQVFDDRIDVLILPEPIDVCTPDEVYDGTTYGVSIVTDRPDAGTDLLHVEQELRDIAATLQGSVSPVRTCWPR